VVDEARLSEALYDSYWQVRLYSLLTLWYLAPEGRISAQTASKAEHLAMDDPNDKVRRAAERLLEALAD
jgi:hypothetical protein